MEALPEASSAPICLIGGTQLLLYIWLLFLKQRWVTLALFGQGSSGPPPPSPLQPPSSSAWEPALPARRGLSVYRSGENEGFRVGRCGNSGLVTFFAWLAAAAAALPVDMEVGSRLLVLRLLFKLLMSSRFFAFSARIYANK